MFILRAVNSFFQILIYLILGRAIMSWFVRPGDRLYPAFLVLVRLTEPILEPCRRILNKLGLPSGVDFSPIAAFLLINVVNWLVIRLLAPIVIGGGL